MTENQADTAETDPERRLFLQTSGVLALGIFLPITEKIPDPAELELFEGVHQALIDCLSIVANRGISDPATIADFQGFVTNEPAYKPLIEEAFRKSGLLGFNEKLTQAIFEQLKITAGRNQLRLRIKKIMKERKKWFWNVWNPEDPMHQEIEV